MRCPKCGNDASKDDFVCVYCGGRLREERIESIPIFRRIEDTWTDPLPKWRRMLLVIVNPSRAFWDITHYREKVGGGLVYLATCIAFGLFGLSIFSHIQIAYSPDPLTNFSLQLLQGLPIFLIFFIFGLIYYFLFFWFGNKLFKWGANYSIGLSQQLKIRYGEGKKKKDNFEEDEKEKSEKTRAQLEAEGEYIVELPDYLTSQKSKKASIMRFAYLPITVSLLVCAIIALVGLPWVTTSVGLDSAVEVLWSSPVWGIFDWVQVIALIGWVPITMSIALRDIANASTQKVYISCLIVSILLSLFVYFLRPTFLFEYMTMTVI